MIVIRYNGRRFPKVVINNGHKKSVFHPDKKELEFSDDEAYEILSQNTKINVNTWEFTIAGAASNAKPNPPAKEAIPPKVEAKPDEAVKEKEDEAAKEKPKKHKKAISK